MTMAYFLQTLDCACAIKCVPFTCEASDHVRLVSIRAALYGQILRQPVGKYSAARPAGRVSWTRLFTNPIPGHSCVPACLPRKNQLNRCACYAKKAFYTARLISYVAILIACGILGRPVQVSFQQKVTPTTL
jgi:hypothetical protein